MDFFHLFMKDDYDYFIQFTALFWKGDLKELNLDSWSKEDNSDRKEIQESIKKACVKSTAKRKKWYASPLGFYRTCVRFICSRIRLVLGWKIDLILKIEKFLT